MTLFNTDYLQKDFALLAVRSANDECYDQAEAYFQQNKDRLPFLRLNGRGKQTAIIKPHKPNQLVICKGLRSHRWHKAIFCHGNNFRIIISCALLLLALSSCASWPSNTADTNQMESTMTQTTDITAMRQAIQDAKTLCAQQKYPKQHRNFERTKCENQRIREITSLQLILADFYALNGFLIDRLDIADQLDHKTITPQQSEIMILRAQSHLTN